MRGNTGRGCGILALFVITGAIGGILGEIISSTAAFSGIAHYLVQTYPIIDLAPVSINLYVIKIALGFTLQPNLISIFGIILAIFLFKRF